MRGLFKATSEDFNTTSNVNLVELFFCANFFTESLPAFAHDTDLNTCLLSFGLFSDCKDVADCLQGVRQGEPIKELISQSTQRTLLLNPKRVIQFLLVYQSFNQSHWCLFISVMDFTCPLASFSWSN